MRRPTHHPRPTHLELRGRERARSTGGRRTFPSGHGGHSLESGDGRARHEWRRLAPQDGREGLAGKPEIAGQAQAPAEEGDVGGGGPVHLEVDTFLDEGMVLIQLDSRIETVEVPPYLREDAKLRLNLALNDLGSSFAFARPSASHIRATTTAPTSARGSLYNTQHTTANAAVL